MSTLHFLFWLLIVFAVCVLAVLAADQLLRWRFRSCRFGHSWATIVIPVYELGGEDLRSTVPGGEGKRICARCGRRERLEEHCLGLNPPTYVRHWQVEP